MQNINVNIVPDNFPQTIRYSQGDIGRQFKINVTDFDIPVGATVKIQATKPSGFGFSVAGVVADNSVTFTTTAEMTDEAGRFQAELQITAGDDVIGTANFLMIGERNPHPEGTTDGSQGTIIPELTLLVERVEKAASDVLDMEVVATTLPAGSQATYSYDEDLNKATFGIPEGQAGAGAAGVVASAYSAAKTYKVGDYVLYNSNLYRCTTAITTAEAWTAAHWTQVVLADDVTDLKTDLQEAIDEFAVPTQEAVDNWLEAHPEATTTVEDGSLTESKFAESLKLKAIKDYVTPQMFGAKGDGITDDTQAFIDCFASLTNGGIVLISEKTYKLTDVFSVLANTSILCQGTINYDLPATQGYKGFVGISGSHIHWDGGTFKGTGALTSYDSGNCVFYANGKDDISIKNVKILDTPCINAIYFENCTNIAVEKVEIKEYTYGGIMLGDACKHGVIRDCVIINGNDVNHNNRYPISASSYRTSASDLPIAYDIVVDSNYIEDASPFWEGIDAHGGECIVVINNVIKGTNSGIVFSRDAGKYDCKNNVVKGNVIVLPTAGTKATKINAGVSICGDGGIVEGNIIENAGYLASNMRGGCGVYFPTMANCVVSNNDFRGCKGYVFTIGTSENILISNNKIEGDSSLGVSQIGIEFTGNCNNIVVENNFWKDVGRMVYGDASFTGEKRIYLKNNISNINPPAYSNIQGIVPDRLANVPTAFGGKAGMAGDIVWNSTPSVGNPIGWVCTSTGTAETPATWSALPNLS